MNIYSPFAQGNYKYKGSFSIVYRIFTHIYGLRNEISNEKFMMRAGSRDK